MGDSQIHKLISMIGKHQAIGGKAEGHFGINLPDKPEGFLCIFDIGKSVSGAGYTNHLQVGYLAFDKPELLSSLHRGQNFTGHPRSALINTVKASVAVIAGYVAKGRHRQMHPGVMTGTFTKAGVLLGSLFNGYFLRPVI